MPQPVFHFKQFSIQQDRCALKVGTDGVALGAWADVADARRILDIGTGTGLLALIAAQRNGLAHIDAVELDGPSAEQAVENISASPWADRIRVHHMDVRRMCIAEPYDLVICNPPFYAGEMGSPDPRMGVAKHAEGLTFTELSKVIGQVLAPEGRLAVISPVNREEDLLSAMGRIGLEPVRRCLVLYLEQRPPKRVLIELAHEGTPKTPQEELVVEHTPGRMTAAYAHLMRDLLLKC